MSHRYRRVLLLLVLAVVGCGTPSPSPVASVPSSTQKVPSSQPDQTATPTVAPDVLEETTASVVPQADTSVAQNTTTTAMVVATPDVASSATSTVNTEGSVFPLTISDSLSRTVTLAAQPTRIVSLAPSNTEILFAVGAGPDVVGVTKYCAFPEEAQQREQIGGFSASTISIEKIVALKPDLVVAGDDSQQEVIEALEQTDIPVLALKAATLADVYQNIALVGTATGHADDADMLVEEMRARVEAVAEKTNALGAEQRPTVFWEVFGEPLITAGPTSFIGQMIELAGGTNLFADVTEDYPAISAEEVLLRNPAVIMGPLSRTDTLSAAAIAQRPGWGALDAVRNDRIILIDDDIASRPGPRLVEALETVARGLHPELDW